MMHTTNIIMLLNAKIRKKDQESSNQLIYMETFGMKLRKKILKKVCNILWMIHLLKTSLLITRTPLTTFKSIIKSSNK